MEIKNESLEVNDSPQNPSVAKNNDSLVVKPSSVSDILTGQFLTTEGEDISNRDTNNDSDAVNVLEKEDKHENAPKVRNEPRKL